MGLSLVAATAIVGVAVLISIELIVGNAIPTITEVHDSYDDMKDRTVKQVQTDVTIENVVWNDPNTEITINNTGTETINTSYCNILFDGTVKQFTCSTSNIYPEQSTTFLVQDSISTGKILKIVTPNGVADYYTV